MRTLRELTHYRSAIVGLVIIGVFVVMAIVAVITIPYERACTLWSEGTMHLRRENPRNARPVWVDYFTPGKLPRTIVVGLEQGTVKVEPLAGGRKQVRVTLPFHYDYDGFPQDIALFVDATYGTRVPVISLYWLKADGTLVTLTEGTSLRRNYQYHFSQDIDLRTRLGERPPHEVLLAVDATETNMKPLHGQYALTFDVVLGEDEKMDDAKLVVYGQVHGLAGTDNIRRDLSVALLWGAAVGLVFGLLGAVGAQLSTFVLAGIGTWYGGKVDFLFQRMTELEMVIPNLPILIMIGYFYSRSIWLMLGIIILLNVFSAGMKTYRAMFLQAKEAPYIEAARAYGTSNMRIVFRYLLPRLAPTLLPGFVLIVPSFVFLEASLAVLGLGDPHVPTWGKMLNDSLKGHALYIGLYHWVLQPAVLLMLIGFGFAMVGFSLDRIFNPRLRTV